MGFIDDAVARAEAKERILEDSRARLQVFLASKNKKPTQNVLADSEDTDAPVELTLASEASLESTVIIPFSEVSALSHSAEAEMMRIEKAGELTKKYLENLNIQSDGFEGSWLGVSMIHFPADTQGMAASETDIINERIKELNNEIGALLEEKKKQRDSYLIKKIESNNDSESEAVIPEVVEGVNTDNAHKISSEKPEVNAETVDIEEIKSESESEVIIPEVVEGPKRKDGNAKKPALEKPTEKMEVIDVEVIEPKKDIFEASIHFAEKDRRIIELSRKLDEARKFYVEQDREMDKGASVWKKIFGFGKRLDSGTLKESFDKAKLGYENALRDYKNEILKTEVQDGEDVEIVAEWLSKGEFLSLESDKIDSKAREGKNWKDKIINGYLGIVDKYRKLSTTKKIILGLGITTVGFGIGLTGGTLLAGGILTSRQLFSMSVSSVGFKGMFDGIARKSKNKKDNKETKNILDEVVDKKSEEKEAINVRILSIKLNEKIEQLDLQMQNEKKNQKYRNWAAFGSGVILSYIGRYFGKEVMEHSGVRESVGNAGEKFVDVTGNQKTIMGVGYHLDANPEIDEEKLGFLQEQATKESLPSADLAETNAEEMLNLKIEKGSSLEGTIIRYLEEQGMKGDEAERKAHQMALEFLGSQEATEHHLIQPDTKVILDASGEHIVKVGGLIGSEAQDGIVDSVVAGDFLDERAGVLLENTNTSLTEWQMIQEGDPNVEKYVSLGGNFTKALAKLIGGNYFEDWSAVKNSSMKEVLRGDSESGKRVGALFDRLLKAKLGEADEETVRQFQEMIKPKGEENVLNWVKRVALLIKYSGIKKI